VATNFADLESVTNMLLATSTTRLCKYTFLLPIFLSALLTAFLRYSRSLSVSRSLGENGSRILLYLIFCHKSAGIHKYEACSLYQFAFSLRPFICLEKITITYRKKLPTERVICFSIFLESATYVPICFREMHSGS